MVGLLGGIRRRNRRGVAPIELHALQPEGLRGGHAGELPGKFLQRRIQRLQSIERSCVGQRRHQLQHHPLIDKIHSLHRAVQRTENSCAIVQPQSLAKHSGKYVNALAQLVNLRLPRLRIGHPQSTQQSHSAEQSQRSSDSSTWHAYHRMSPENCFNAIPPDTAHRSPAPAPNE